MSFSNLDLVRQCDTFSTSEGAYEFRYREFLLGYVCKKVAGALHELPKGWWKVEKNHIRFAEEADTSMERRCEVIRMTVDTWRIRKRFKVLEKWRDELYSVYAPSHTVLFTIERAASPLFGVATFGVHMIAFTTNPLMLWVPKRAQNKTHGGKYDNTVAGGIAHGYDVLDTLVKESEEEAGFHESLIRSKACPVGAVSYHYIRGEQAGGETGLYQPEYEYVYDLELDKSVIPKPNDDEVDHFELWSVNQVKENLRQGSFKTNCALVTIDFFIRHGIINADNEPDYIEIQQRCHRDMPFPVM